jgi:hypothetical protein
LDLFFLLGARTAIVRFRTLYARFWLTTEDARDIHRLTAGIP